MSASAKGPPTPPPAELPPRDNVITCNACGMRSRSAMMIKPLGAEKALCVNTAACEKRQRQNAKVKP